MKSLQKRTKELAFVLAVLLLFQGCKVYHSDTVTLEQASKEYKRTKVQTNSNETLKFRAIKVENNKFYGVKKVKGELINIPLDVSSIKSVRLVNETMSTVLTIAIPVTILLGTLVIIGSTLTWDSGDWDY